MTDHLKQAGDVGATAIGVVSLTSHMISTASQWAQVLGPIASLVLTCMGIVWWCIRFGEWRQATGERRVGEEDAS